jgi:hypothetical protein
MKHLIAKYTKLKLELVNAGEERNCTEVMWNEMILLEIAELLQDVNKDIIKQLIKSNIL